jgi:SET domain
MDIHTPSAYRIVSNHVFAERRQKLSNDQNALFALRSYQPGEAIADFSAGTISAEPTYLTVQVGIGKHITLQPEFLQYINHSCEPNVFFNTTTMQLVALKDIQPEEELTFFYPSTEWAMTQSFNCYCGSSSCIGEIKGASFLSNEVATQYRFTDFIQTQLAEKAMPADRQAAQKVA